MSTIVFEGERFEDTEDGRRMAAEEVIRAGYLEEEFEEYVDDRVSAYGLLMDLIDGSWTVSRVLDDLSEQFIGDMVKDPALVDRLVDDFCEVQEGEE